jgi:hypothetical protein
LLRNPPGIADPATTAIEPDSEMVKAPAREPKSWNESDAWSWKDRTAAGSDELKQAQSNEPDPEAAR